MDPNLAVAIIGGVILLGVFLAHMSKRTGWPLSLILLILGIFIGPVFNFIDVVEFQGMIHSFAIIALILVLFDTGYDIKLSRFKNELFESTSLALVGLFSTMLVVFLIGRYLLHLDVYLAILFGAILGSTDLTIISPLMKNMKLKKRVKESLDIEATLNSVFAAVTAIVVSSMIIYSSNFAEAISRGVFYPIFTAIALGLIIGWVLLKGMRYFILEDMPAIITIGAIFVVYAITEMIGASGVIAALIVGILYGNINPSPPKFIMSFGENLQFILVTFVYIFLGALITFDAFRNYSLIAITLVSSIIIVRYFSVKLATLNESLLAKRVIGISGPRGIISAILILTYAHLFPNPDLIIGLGFAVILCTSLIVFLLPVIKEKTDLKL
jgi:potassium/hydrogen antiporter